MHHPGEGGRDLAHAEGLFWDEKMLLVCKVLTTSDVPMERAQGAIKSVYNNHRAGAPPVYSVVINTRGRDQNIKWGSHGKGGNCEISETFNMNFKTVFI